MNATDRQLLTDAGWSVECESPFEIRHAQSSSFATNRAAEAVLELLKQDQAPTEELPIVGLTSLQKAEELLGLARELVKIAAVASEQNNPESWELAYDLVFKGSNDRFNTLIRELKISFDWFDPDCGYKDDVLAYTQAVEQLIERLSPFV